MADVVIDSNIWCYYFDKTTPEHEIVISYLDNLFDKMSVAINVVILMECSHYLIKNLGSIIGKEKIDILTSSGIEITELTFDESKSAINFLSKYSHLGIGGRDATILACMQKLHINQLITHDKSFTRINDISVIDPVSP